MTTACPTSPGSIRRFLDLGSGIPTVGTVHEIARWRGTSIRVAHVDDERIAVAHSAAIVADVPGATITDADPGGLLARYRRAPASGSVLAVTHVSDDHPHLPDFAWSQREAIALAGGPAHPVHLRSRAAIVAVMERGGFRADAEGPVEPCRWAVPARREPLGAYAVISEPPASGD